MQTPSGSQEALTFVVRLWRETGAAGQRCWRGRVENVGTQAVCYVESAAGVAEVIERWMAPVPQDEGNNEELTI